MNKYQRAVNNIVTYYGLLNVTKEHYQELADTLQELVDKATPEKVIKWLSDGSMACCPWCHGAEYAEERHNYCHFCGKALDWSEHD